MLVIRSHYSNVYLYVCVSVCVSVCVCVCECVCVCVISDTYVYRVNSIKTKNTILIMYSIYLNQYISIINYIYK